jgi:hypothetical protein
LLEVIALLQFAVAIDKRSDLQLSVLAHALKGGVFPKGILDLEVDLVDLDLEVINLSPQIANGLLVDVHLDLVLVLSSLLLVQQEGVLGLDVGNLVVQSQEVVFEVLELEQFLLEGGDDGVLVLGLSLVEQARGGEVAVHVPDGN